MNSLLKYFIETTIGWKDFSVIEKSIATDLLLLEDFEKDFHVEYFVDSPNLVRLWKISTWNKKRETDRLLYESVRKSVDELIAKYNKAFEYLTGPGNLSEQDAREMLENPLIKAKFGL